MKATKIYYQKCFNLGNYENEVIGIELEIEQGEKSSEVLEKARYFVNSKSITEATVDGYERCKKIAENPDDYTGRQIKEAQAFLDKNGEQEDLPF